MKKIEIYNYETNETFAIIETRKKNLQLEALNYLKQNNYRVLLQGKVTYDFADVYWLSYNPNTKEQLKLWYREAEKEKTISNLDKDITEDLELSM
jgi:hypothetical protein